MVKKCIICEAEAVYKIKDNSDFYCQECAEENFADLTMLVKVEEEAQRLKEFLKEKMVDLVRSEEELNQMIIINEKKEDDEQDDKDRED
jgi:hypothetical protein